MKQSTKRLMSSVVALVFVALAFIIFFNFVKPTYGDVADLKGQVAAKQEVVMNEQAVAKKIQSLVSIYDSSDDARLEAGLALPTSTMMAEALAQINGIAVTQNLAPQTYSVSVEAASSVSNQPQAPSSPLDLIQPVSPITFQARFIGTYAAFKGFLANLQTNVRVFDIKTISIQPVGKSNQDLYSFDLRFVGYYQGLPDVPTSTRAVAQPSSN